MPGVVYLPQHPTTPPPYVVHHNVGGGLVWFALVAGVLVYGWVRALRWSIREDRGEPTATFVKTRDIERYLRRG